MYKLEEHIAYLKGELAMAELEKMSLADAAGVEPSSGSQVPEAKPIKRIKTDEPAVAAEAPSRESSPTVFVRWQQSHGGDMPLATHTILKYVPCIGATACCFFWMT